ncbi:MAG: hypothetical protein ABI083_09315, partial [Lapillicoccus sp.]
WGNQSLNGLLLRTGLPVSVEHLLWLSVVAILVGAGLARARRLHRLGDAPAATVVVGCATILASPVSWTHHQFWTVLAAMVMIGTTGRPRRVAGWVLLTIMTINLGQVLDVSGSPTPGTQYLADNLRGLAACALCVTGLLAATSGVSPVTTGSDLVSTTRWRRPPRLRVIGTLLVVVALFVVLPLPSRGTTRVTPATTGQASALVSSWGYCSDGECRTGGILFPVNYTVGWDVDLVSISGLANPAVTRIDYVPSPGRPPVHLVLDPLPTGEHAWAFTSGDTAYGQLLVYSAHDHLIGEYGRKLREG